MNMLTQLPPAADYPTDPAPAPIHDVGRLTAEAMKAEYESAAKEIEALGTQLMTVKARLDKEQQNLLEALDAVNTVAKVWREKGDRISATVEDCAKQTQRVRNLCADLAWPDGSKLPPPQLPQP